MTDEKRKSGFTIEHRIETDENQRYENPMRLARRCCRVYHFRLRALAYSCGSRRHFFLSISDRNGEIRWNPAQSNPNRHVLRS